MNPRILLAALLGMSLPTILAAADSPAKAPAKAKSAPDPALVPVADTAGRPRVMTENGVALDDLHAAITPHLPNQQRPNDVHFSAAGSELLAKHVAASIEAALKSK